MVSGVCVDCRFVEIRYGCNFVGCFRVVLVVVFVVLVWFADGFVIYWCAKFRVCNVGWLVCI